MTPKLRTSDGFSLIELMVTISIVAVLLAIAVPSFQDASLNSQLRSMANELASGFRYARSESFKRNAVVTLCVSNDGATCATGGWEQGWIIKAGATVLNRQSPAPNGFKIRAAGGSNTLQFQPTGAGTTSDALTVCRATPNVGRAQRIVAVDATGRASIATSTATTCG